ncbi:MAG: SCO family protein [Candidatus Marinimicrobia bacterium]|nr:SCO family protein [Candidatus Neomarinimicrobiota bacterium]
MFVLLLAPLLAQQIKDNDRQLIGIDVIEHLGDTIPSNLSFLDENGNSVKLSSLFITGKPTILTLAYYECPMLCTFVLNGLGEGLGKIPYSSGEDYKLITVSIDPNETPQHSTTKKDVYEKEYNKISWSFLVGDSIEIKSLSEALGFQYYYDLNLEEYAHPAVVFILTPDGVISRYLYGLHFWPQDLKLSLLEASKGRIGNTIDKLILYCFQYDPDAGSYVVFAANVMRLGGLVTVVIMGIFFGILWTKERKMMKRI